MKLFLVYEITVTFVFLDIVAANLRARVPPMPMLREINNINRNRHERRR